MKTDYEVDGVKWKLTSVIDLDGYGIHNYRIVNDAGLVLHSDENFDSSRWPNSFDVMISTLGGDSGPYKLEMEIKSKMGGIYHNAYYDTFELASRVANDILRREMDPIEELFDYYGIH